MSHSVNRQELAHQVVLLGKGGMSHRAIARALRIGRRTVRRLLEQHAVERQKPQLALPARPALAPRPSKLDAHREVVQQLLNEFPDITAQRIFEELKTRGFTGGYTAVKQLARKLRPKPKPKISFCIEPEGPGKVAECDWSPYRVDFTHAPSRLFQAFSFVLLHSRRKYFHFFSSCDLHALMDGHVQVFSAFEGVPEATKYDSQKPVVLRWEGPQPIYNPRFVDFATYYEFQPRACRRGHPNDKPFVERSFWELERSFFNGRKFRDEEDLRAQLRHWMASIGDLRPHRTTKRAPLELFAEEKPFLQPLPSHPYDTARVLYRLCDSRGFVAWETNRYSVPAEHVTDILPVRITQHELYVYAAHLSLVARHELRPKGAGVEITLPGHHPACRSEPVDLDQLRQAFEQLGPPAASFLRGLEAEKPRSTAYHARHILALRERYATGDLLAALEHALAFGAFEHSAIERILLARAQPRRLDEYVARETARKLETVLGQSTTEPRDLTEYDALPCWSSQPQGEHACPEDESTTAPLPTDRPANRQAGETEPNPASTDSSPTSNDSD